MSRDLSYLVHILQTARLLQEFVADIDRETFERDVMRQFAVMRPIEIIGEATRRLSESFRASYALIPWKGMAGMRSKLIHDYDTVGPSPGLERHPKRYPYPDRSNRAARAARYARLAR